MDASRVQILRVGQEADGQRLDNFLLRHLKGLPKSRTYRIVRKGEVRINGCRVKPSTRLKLGDLVRVPPIRDLREKSSAVGNFRDLESMILHEDDNLIVLNKPAGMAVHGGSGVSAGVIETIRRARTDLSSAELVHRLDRATSGCLMIAKRRHYLKVLQDSLRQPGTITKTYEAVVHGRWRHSTLVIEEPLLTNSRSNGERHTRVHPDGKPALTLVRCKIAGDDLSLIEVKPMTGRTHQIRVHCRWHRHAIVGDDRYGDKDADKCLKVRPGRMLLHAKQLIIPAMDNYDSIEVTASLDTAFRTFLESTLIK